MTALLGGRYRPLGRIATGGMGEVWRAKDELLGREVAVKLLRRHVATDPAFRDRFRMEARIAARLADPRIAQVFDYGEADDVAYLVMELVPGESLASILARDGALGSEVTLEVVHQTAKGLRAAHGAGIIHRDIKPGNLLVTGTGVIKITDFGIARALEMAPVTQTGTVLGTAQYLSPEQASGAPLTFATDIYSLGVVAYECLAGKPPFVAETQVAIALMHINESPRPLPESVPLPVRNLVMACLSKDPGLRPADAGELAERANALRGSVATAEAAGAAGAAGATDLALLTDPAGWRAEPAGEWPREVAPALVTPGEPVPGAIPADSSASGTSPEGPLSGTARVPVRRGRLRRTTVIVAAVAGCAALGLGTLVVRDLTTRPGDNGPTKPAVPTASATRTPSARPSKTKPVTTRPPVAPPKSLRPIPTPSATVSTSATPSVQPTQSPSPSPSPTTPTPTPTTPPATPSLTPSATPTPGDTNQPNGET
ncbi:serine/threonine-protein kinase [Streptosporangium sp. NPDC051023]|uniref:serine/threonine-protein kinase n=1 Tax=Streptosporangium sp. NPDC051023 TaxID=3155410 RepID=UPI00344C7DAE